MSKTVIFGTRDTASLAHFYLTHDSQHEPAAFCVHERYLPESGVFEGKPVVPFETLQDTHPPEDFAFFAPMTYRRMNRDREQVFHTARSQGYELISYVSSRAILFPDAQIGSNCFILEANVIQPFTTVGDNVVMWSGNHIGHHSRIGDHVFFTSHVTLSGRCVVERNSVFGVNCCVRDGLKIAEGSFIAMGAAVISDTEPWGVYRGVPAVKHEGRSDRIEE